MNNKRKAALRLVGLLFVIVLLAATVKFVLFKKAPAAAAHSTETMISTVEIIKDGTWGKPALYGFSRLQESLQGKGVSISQIPSLAQASTSFILLLGIPGESGEIQRLLKEGKFELSQKKEALAIKKIKEGDNNILVVAGSDDRGLMYALLGLSHQSPGDLVLGRQSGIPILPLVRVPVSSCVAHMQVVGMSGKGKSRLVSCLSSKR